MQKELTIIIPTKNEEKYLGTLLNSLIDQDYPCMAATRVLVADAGSTDGTRRLAESFKGRLDLEVIPGGTPSVGRNNGAHLATTPYILFIDADIFVRRTMIRRTLAYLKHYGWHAATTNILCKTGIFLDQAFYFTLNTTARLMGFGTGMFLLFERQKFLELGGFDARILYAEDVFLTKQLPRNRFGHVPGAVLAPNRRFRHMGYSRLGWLWLKTVFNLYNDRFYYRDHSYWQYRVSD
ncbi:MAG: glycosyltransferase family A protein [Deltaproteobacteria bacterium]|nr:glycosyltransferase family A protein [Deltaproteobacteria bacterium]